MRGPALTGVCGCFWLLASLGVLNSPLPLRFFLMKKRSAVGTLALGIGCTAVLVRTLWCHLLVPVAFCSITRLTVAALALPLGICTGACLRFKPLAQSSHPGERLNVAGAGRAPAKSGGGHGCRNVYYIDGHAHCGGAVNLCDSLEGRTRPLLSRAQVLCM